jgi:hypothetical protein
MMVEESGVSFLWMRAQTLAGVILIGPNIAPQHLRCFAKMAKVYANHKFA